MSQPIVPSKFGFRPLSSAQARRRGVLLVLIGLFLAALSAVILAVLFEFIDIATLLPGTYRDPSTGPSSVPVLAWAAVGFFGVFGLVSILQGVWQIATGARNKLLTIVMIAMAFVFVAAGLLARGMRAFN